MKKEKKAAIGFFDSGFGGLTILKEVVTKLPQYDYVYLGDTARTPYGNRSQKIIYEFTEEAVTLLFNQGCDLVILACNTASSEALRRIQEEYIPAHYPGKKVLGVLIPAAEEAAAQTKNNRVGVLATEGTVTSGAFIRELQKLNPSVQVFQQAAPLLVPSIEAGEHTLPATELLLEHYLRPLLVEKIDTLILGCTHYSILETAIKSIVGQEVTIITEGAVVAKKLQDYLQRHPEVEQNILYSGDVRFLTTDATEKFSVLGTEFFGSAVVPEQVMLTHPSD
jgi:glutamate racemase